MLLGHGDDAYENIKINFSSNVWYGADLSGLTTHLTEKIKDIKQYPEIFPKNLIQKIAAFHNVSENSILVTNGATEAIYLIARAFSGSDTSIIYPTFAEYADACNICNHKISFISENNFSSDSLPDKGLVFICNPNNPTGKVYVNTFIIKLLESHPDCLFVIDEAYSEFTLIQTSVVPLLSKYSNLIIIKSVTKSFCIPGLRLGYVLADAQIIAKFKDQKMPWSVNTLAIAAGEYIFDHYSDYAIPVKEWFNETKWFVSEIREKTNCRCTLNNAPFFLCISPKGKASKLKKDLIEKHQILIRDASNFNGLTPLHFRLCTQSHNDNLVLIDVLSKW